MKLAVVTGADHHYFDLMYEIITTLKSINNSTIPKLCVLDFGLLPEQIDRIRQYEVAFVRPEWTIDAPAPLRTSANLGYATRPMLPRYFPGFDMYLWLDADVSIRSHRFISAFTAAARSGHLAIAEEIDPSYGFEPHAVKWQIGNAFRCFGLRQGLKLSLGRPINSGVFALEAEAPHWALWQERYQQAVQNADRVNLDQHALMAVLYLDGLPCRYLDSTYNWICARSQPLWDETRQAFCRPYAPFDTIDVLHLAGRNKRKLWTIKTLDGAAEPMRLSYTGRQQGTLLETSGAA